MDGPRYLRFARALALCSSGAGALVACASEVNVGDGAVTDTGASGTDSASGPTHDSGLDVTGDSSLVCPEGCPSSQPANGAPCAHVMAGQGCPYTHNGALIECQCTSANTGTCAEFTCFTAAPGPLLPPELAGECAARRTVTRTPRSDPRAYVGLPVMSAGAPRRT